MIRAGWLVVVSFSALFMGCGAKDPIGISPYAEMPKCPPPGAYQTRECYYTLRMTTNKTKNQNPDWASGSLDRSGIRKGQKETWIGIDLNHHFPEFIYNFEVEGHQGNFAEGSPAHFVSKPNSSVLVFLSPEKLCDMKAKMIRKHGTGDNPTKKTYEKYQVDEEFIRECPNLAHVWDEKSP